MCQQFGTEKSLAIKRDFSIESSGLTVRVNPQLVGRRPTLLRSSFRLVELRPNEPFISIVWGLSKEIRKLHLHSGG
jgi:hypothetical protein